jgi:hypothetical protein
MEPVEFLARLAALIPPPRFPLVRFAGVLAPRSKWRARVVPQPPPTPTKRAKAEPQDEKPDGVATAAPPRQPHLAPGAETQKPQESFAHNLAAQTDAVDVVAPNILSLSHWARLHNGELYAAQPRVNWSVLLRRTFDVDVKTCPSCGGRLHVRAVVTEHETAAKILQSLARTRAPPRAA